MNYRWFLLFCITLVGLTACSSLQKPLPSTEKESVSDQKLLSALVHRNSSLKTFKGIGRASLRRDDKQYAFRLAWAGAEPDKLRLEIMGAPGQPKAGFSSDGQYLYYFDPKDVEDPVKKTSSKNPSLRNFLSIPITVTDIVSFLSGRIPDYAAHHLRIRKRTDGDGYVLVLEKQWWQGVRHEIFLDSDRTEILKIETYKAGKLECRIAFPKMQTVEGYRVPLVLTLSNDNGIFFKLSIERYWANAALPPGLFVLKAPDR